MNTSTRTLDLSGVILADGSSDRHVFASGTALACGRAIVVFGGGDPLHVAWQPNWVTATDGMLGLNNTSDTATVSSPDGQTTLAEVVYPDLGAEEDEAIVRQIELDSSAASIEHSTHPQAGGRPFSPGTRVDGTSF